jgi:hypothetical protein
MKSSVGSEVLTAVVMKSSVGFEVLTAVVMKGSIGSEVLTAVAMKSSICWDITPCSLDFHRATLRHFPEARDL